MQNLDHPNIAEYYESYDDTKYKYICSELVEGEDLIDHIIFRPEPLEECQSAVWIKKLA
tara:strand:+ start:295 stop:471 length:177 start_codon:yes stop_codon:yes gene_type:complete